MRVSQRLGHRDMPLGRNHLDRFGFDFHAKSRAYGANLDAIRHHDKRPPLVFSDLKIRRAMLEADIDFMVVKSVLSALTRLPVLV